MAQRVMLGVEVALVRRVIAVVLAAVLFFLIPLEGLAKWPWREHRHPLPTSTLLPCEEAKTDLVAIDKNTHLDPSCTYRHGIEITSSNVVLDCRGALLEAPTNGRFGIIVRAPADADKALENIVVRNCRVRGFLNNLRVSRDGFEEMLRKGEEPDYATGGRHIRFEKNVLEESRGSGVFIDAYVTGVTLRDLEITDSGGVGIYLEAGSKDNVVQRCDIHDNGYGDVNAGEIPFEIAIDGLTLKGAYVSTGREGIAIDGSRNNLIIGNRISGNSAGGIFLYKNCGEFFNTEPDEWWPRFYGANGNLIVGNLISDEENGIWNGSRMAANQLLMDCSDSSYPEPPLPTRLWSAKICMSQTDTYPVPVPLLYHEDHAARNFVWWNRFENVRYGIRVEDDANRVIWNTFKSDDPEHQAIIVGTKARTSELDRPVTGTVMLGNRASIQGNPHPYRWIHAREDTVYGLNSSGGKLVDLIEGQQPPIDPLLFVEDFCLEELPLLPP